MSGNDDRPSTSSRLNSGKSRIFNMEERNRQIQQENLMQKIRARNARQPKSYDDLKKLSRQYYTEKHYALDPVCKTVLQSALDKLQSNIKVNSREALVERLQNLSRHLGLKFMEDAQCLFISTDMFYLEILLDDAGKVKDVKVHHECKIEQQSCTELVECLLRSDFNDFTIQLDGLSSIYQLNAEPKVKAKAFVALQAMETDVYNIYQMQKLNGNGYEMMMQSSVGLVMQRRGGHPMKLTYFCPPIHVPAKETVKKSEEFTTEEIIRSLRSLSGAINLEGSKANKLQMQPTVTFNNEIPVYAPLTQTNSMLMPATYVMRLSEPLPVNYNVLIELGFPFTTNDSSITTATTTSPTKQFVTSCFIKLVVQNVMKCNEKDLPKKLFVNLPGKPHTYFFEYNDKLQGISITSIQFTEPSHVPKIIGFLKEQAIFYTLLESCVRVQQNEVDINESIYCEVQAVTFSQITVFFHNTISDVFNTIDFKIERGVLSCIHYVAGEEDAEMSGRITSIARRLYSIPMVIYKFFKWQEAEISSMQGLNVSHGGNSNAGGFGENLSGSIDLNRFQGLAPSMSCGTMRSSSGVTSTGPSNKARKAVILPENIDFSLLDPDTSDNNQEMQQNIPVYNEGRDIADSHLCLLRLAQIGKTNPTLQREGAAAMAAMLNLDVGDNLGQFPHPAGCDCLTKVGSGVDISNLQQSVSITPIQKTAQDMSNEPSTSRAAMQGMTQPQPQGKLQSQAQAQSKSPSQCPTTNIDVTRTGGIEIIPLSTQISALSLNSGTNTPQQSSAVIPAPVAPASTITITPITSSGPAKEPKEKKSTTPPSTSVATSSGSSSLTTTKRSESSTEKEKKRKKKRDDSPMGPPEKVLSRQNSPAASSDSGGATASRKFTSPSSSPKGSGGSGLLPIPPPLPGQHSTRPSPKHSPVYSSPKHTTASNSPKSPFGTHSPKHGSSGKPSMSTLKSATASTSLSPKSDKTASAGTIGTAIGASSSASTSVASIVRSFASSTATSSFQTTTAASSSTAGGLKSRDKDKIASSSTCPPLATVGSSLSSTSIAIMSGGSLKNVVALQQQVQPQQVQQVQMKSVPQLGSAASSSYMGHGGPSVSAGTAGTSALDAALSTAMHKSMTGGAVTSEEAVTSTTTEGEIEAEAEPETEAEPEPELDQESESKPVGEAEPETEAETEIETEAEMGTSTSSEDSSASSSVMKGKKRKKCYSSGSSHTAEYSKEGLKVIIHKVHASVKEQSETTYSPVSSESTSKTSSSPTGEEDSTQQANPDNNMQLKTDQDTNLHFGSSFTYIKKLFKTANVSKRVKTSFGSSFAMPQLSASVSSGDGLSMLVESNRFSEFSSPVAAGLKSGSLISTPTQYVFDYTMRSNGGMRNKLILKANINSRNYTQQLGLQQRSISAANKSKERKWISGNRWAPYKVKTLCQPNSTIADMKKTCKAAERNIKKSVKTNEQQKSATESSLVAAAAKECEALTKVVNDPENTAAVIPVKTTCNDAGKKFKTADSLTSDSVNMMPGTRTALEQKSKTDASTAGPGSTAK